MPQNCPQYIDLQIYHFHRHNDIIYSSFNNYDVYKSVKGWLLSNLNDILNQANSMQITLAHLLKPIVIQALDFEMISISLWSFGLIT